MFLNNPFSSLFDRESVYPIRGSVVYCDLFLGYAEHSGVYVGGGKIIHLNGDGVIEIVTTSGFMKDTTADEIYVSCRDEYSVGSEKVARRAEDLCRKKKKRNYHFIFDNCHQFTSSCLTGDTENADNFLIMLKLTSSEVLKSNTWRTWK